VLLYYNYIHVQLYSSVAGRVSLQEEDKQAKKQPRCGKHQL